MVIIYVPRTNRRILVTCEMISIISMLTVIAPKMVFFVAFHLQEHILPMINSLKSIVNQIYRLYSSANVKMVSFCS